MMQNYDKIIEEKVLRVFSEMDKRVSTEDMVRIQEAYELAREAHAEQKRKTGEPYIIPSLWLPS
jgi:GTP pyrophosphokinase